MINKARDHQSIEQELTRDPILASVWDVLIDNPYEGLVVVDKHGYVVLVNRTYQEVVAIKRKDALGKHITEITPNTKLPVVIKTQQPILYEPWEANNHKLIVHRIPIFNSNGEVIGAIGKSLFADISSGKLLALKLRQLEKELELYKEEVRTIYTAKYTCENLIGESKQIKEIKRLAQRVAPSSSTILITGESGTGKEVLAQAIHNASSRKRHSFVRVNCAAVPENLLETELFGYEDGAFTGAKKGGKPGKFELAQCGTIFLDEIGDMPLAMQSKLLTVLQEREVERIGGIKTFSLDVRVISATNQNLEEMVKNNTFREDLYYRLNVINFKLPSLRERPEDIPLLIYYLTDKLNQKLHSQIEGYTDKAIELMKKYHWPGNVRQLENVLERMFSFTEDKIISLENMPFLENYFKNIPTLTTQKTLAEVVVDTEKDMITKTLQQVAGNRNKAAEILGIHPSVLYRKIKKYSL